MGIPPFDLSVDEYLASVTVPASTRHAHRVLMVAVLSLSRTLLHMDASAQLAQVLASAPDQVSAAVGSALGHTDVSQILVHGWYASVSATAVVWVLTDKVLTRVEVDVSAQVTVVVVVPHRRVVRVQTTDTPERFNLVVELASGASAVRGGAPNSDVLSIMEPAMYVLSEPSTSPYATQLRAFAASLCVALG